MIQNPGTFTQLLAPHLRNFEPNDGLWSWSSSSPLNDRLLRPSPFITWFHFLRCFVNAMYIEHFVHHDRFKLPRRSPFFNSNSNYGGRNDQVSDEWGCSSRVLTGIHLNAMAATDVQVVAWNQWLKNKRNRRDSEEDAAGASMPHQSDERNSSSSACGSQWSQASDRRGNDDPLTQAGRIRVTAAVAQW